jgi:hypothetical protein
MTVEDRIRSAFASFEAVEASPDLFERIRGSIADDRTMRRRRWLLGGVLIGLVAALALFVSASLGGHMDWWVLELITTVLLIGLALFIGPFIRRFGKAYAADIFRANPRTGKSFVVLTDVAYFLIFAAYILLTAHFEPRTSWFELDGLTRRAVVNGAQVQWEAFRVGGILLIIGVLHSINLVVLPVVGRLFTLNLKLDKDLLEEKE